MASAWRALRGWTRRPAKRMMILPGPHLAAAAAAASVSASISRRDAIASSIAAASSVHGSRTVVPATRVADFICEYSNGQFLSSVAAANYRFLYRGLSAEQMSSGGHDAVVVGDGAYDLLDPETYGSDAAAAYFRELDDEMDARRLGLRPSNSHLATTCPADASTWGPAASVWPLGPDASFAWFEEDRLFWPVGTGERTLVTDDSSSLSVALCVDGHEVMLRSDGGYLAVPSHLDHQLRQQLISMTR